MTRRSSLIEFSQQTHTVPRRLALLQVGTKTRRAALLNLHRTRELSPTLKIAYKDHKGRQFHVTRRGAYVVHNGDRLLYGRKARAAHTNNVSRIPARIRPKRRQLRRAREF